MSVLRQLLAYFRGLLDRLFGRAKKEDPVVAPLVVALGLVGSDAVQTGGGGGESLITIVSVKNTAGATKTNEIDSVADAQHVVRWRVEQCGGLRR